MGITQSHRYSEEQNELARLFRVLGHPARLAILQHLIRINACINGDLVKELGLAQATISQHLRELKEVGLVQGSIEGSSVSYCINPSRWDELQELLQEFMNQPQPATHEEDCCSTPGSLGSPKSPRSNKPTNP